MFKLFKRNNITIINATAHKVGSTWVQNVINDVLKLSYKEIPTQYREMPNLNLLNLQSSGFMDWVFDNASGSILKSHTFPPYVEFEHKHISFVTVIRDPRDLMVSSIHYLTKLSPEKGGWEEFKDLSFVEKFHIWIERNKLDYALLEQWYKCEYAYKFHYEKLLEDPKVHFEDFFNSIGVEVSEKRLLKSLDKNSFKAKKQSTQNGNNNFFFRSGKSNDWKNYFDEDVKTAYKNFDGGKFCDLLISMNYEKDTNW